MRKTGNVFTSAERRALALAVIATAAIVGGGIALDRVFGPSLGSYDGGGFGQSAMPGVIDAQPAA